MLSRVVIPTQLMVESGRRLAAEPSTAIAALCAANAVEGHRDTAATGERWPHNLWLCADYWRQ